MKNNMPLQTMITICQMAILIGIILTGLGSFGAYYYGKRSDEEKERESALKEAQLSTKIDSLLLGNQKLNHQLESFEQLATKFYPELGRGEALEKLKKDFENLQNDLIIQKSTIRDFASRLKIVLSGKWTSDPYPEQLMSPVDQQYYIELENSNPTGQSIKFYATEAYQFHTIDKNRAAFDSRQAVHKGDYPIGKLINELSSFTKIKLYVPFILGDRIVNRQIIVERIELVFIINGEECNPLIVTQLFEAKIIREGINMWVSLVLQVDPSIVRDSFKIRSK